MEAEGLLAVCIQHEIDHLEGKLFVDYLSPLKRQLARKKVKKEQRQRDSGAENPKPRGVA
jgi:peptide deformylase